MPSDKDREDEARKFLREIDSIDGIFDDYERNALPVVLARDARLKSEALREAAERAIDFYDKCGFGDKKWSRTNLRAAILADEPLEEDLDA